MGDPADDVGAMVAHLEAAIISDPSRSLCIREASSQFIDAYDISDISDMADRITTYSGLHTMLLGYQALRYPSPTALDKAEHLLLLAYSHISGGLK